MTISDTIKGIRKIGVDTAPFIYWFYRFLWFTGFITKAHIFLPRIAIY
jgi:hypothetical protein